MSSSAAFADASDPAFERLTAIVTASPTLMRVLTAARTLALPDWLIFSGAVYQRVFNHLTGRPLDYGIKDYDLAYYDDGDTSYEAEDIVIRRVAAAFEPPLRGMVEVRNQARVYLWFHDHYGEPYAPLTRSAEALTRFTSPTFAVGVRLEADDRLHIEAPFGLDDLFAMRIRRNPTRQSTGFLRTALNAKTRWPEVTILDV